MWINRISFAAANITQVSGAGPQSKSQTNKDAFSTILCLLTPGLNSSHSKHMLHGVRSTGSHPRGTAAGCVCHAEADSRNPLTGVVAEHTTVSDPEEGAESASVCGMSALCLKRVEKVRGSFCNEIGIQHGNGSSCVSVASSASIRGFYI